ncbi:MAG TPA: chemotaxis protein CheA [Nitrospiria bacterium]|nr:chemotaxis protein CheA [Nitrospiria bacterium]
MGSESLNSVIAEAEEIIDGLNQNLLAMEASDKSNVKPDLLNSVFRAAHTLKGISGMAGLKNVSDLSHRMEELLDGLRMGRLRLTGKLLDTLFESVDTLRRLLEMASSGSVDVMDLTPVLKKIEAEVSNSPDKEPSIAPAGVELSQDIYKVLTEYETHRLNENIKSGMGLYEIKARFKFESFDKDLVDLNKKLQEIGEIITTLPSTGMSPESGIEFNLIVGTGKDYLSMQNALDGESVEILVIGGGKTKVVQAEKGVEAPPQSMPGDATESIKSLAKTIRVDIAKLDSLLNMVGELVLTKSVISRISKDLLREGQRAIDVSELQKASQDLDRKVSMLQGELVEARMIPIGQVFERLLRIVRKISKELNKEITLLISGEETKLDKSMVEEIADPLMHLVRNAIDHGIEGKEERLSGRKPEAGTIKLSAQQKGNSVVVEVEDDGAGVDLSKVYKKALERGLLEESKEYGQKELFNFLFLPGFTTKEEATDISGRGVGLDVVAKNIGKLGGMVDMDTELGKGTKFTLTLPITMVIIKALIVSVGGETFAIPINSVSESLMIKKSDIRTVEKHGVIQLRDRTLSLLWLREIFALPSKEESERLYVIVVGLAEKRLGLIVDAIEGQQEVVIKSIGKILKDIPGIAGATELGNRKTILVLDIGALIDEATSVSSRSGT